MPVKYINKGKKTYYLHQGKTKTGKPKYYFSMKDKGNLVEKIPGGYKIYEHPANAQVFLRKKQPQIVTDIESYLINKYLNKLKRPYRYIFDIKGKIITIFESNQNIDAIKELFKRMPFGKYQSESCIAEMLDQETTYRPVMRFILEDETRRIFVAERFCFKGSVDDWININMPDSLENLLKTYLKRLGKDSFYEFF